MIDLGSSILLDEEELIMIHNMVTTLESVKLAVEALCRRTAALLSADTMIFLCYQKFGHQQFSRLVERIAFTSNELTAN
jgi:hypothetical protein